MENKEESRIRISAASLARIVLDGKLLVGLNKSRLKAGKQVYTMFGGALEFHEGARAYLQSLDAVFEKKNDIRMDLAESRLAEFEQWFYRRENRETGVLRELAEEFVEEEHVLDRFDESQAQASYLFTIKQRAVTDRAGQENKVTQRYLEVHDVVLSKAYVDAIKYSLAKEDSRLALVSKEEVLAGKTRSGIEIAVASEVLEGLQ